MFNLTSRFLVFFQTVHLWKLPAPPSKINDDEDSLEDDIGQLILTDLARLKSSRYCSREAYRQWDISWERMLEDGMYMYDEEFLSNFRMDRSCVRQLNGLIEDDEVFQRVWER